MTVHPRRRGCRGCRGPGESHGWDRPRAGQQGVRGVAAAAGAYQLGRGGDGRRAGETGPMLARRHTTPGGYEGRGCPPGRMRAARHAPRCGVAERDIAALRAGSRTIRSDHNDCPPPRFGRAFKARMARPVGEGGRAARRRGHGPGSAGSQHTSRKLTLRDGAPGCDIPSMP
ncbi:hypothetical protein FRACA_990003 [Frankia canadensis]|uniref:Uncharacterized protein n=1 Tax=Frankia canadensis TaxID=1836972 RepID=A0A2I2L2V9_9ACTN|nr:hypothetical protein FRACA_990003 [Frankia canadensis]SOU59553.1 hypothetical protein FRACA_990003 [Frankia canadensis]